MKKPYPIIVLSFFMGLLVWVVDAALDYLLFYKGTFLELLITDVPPHDAYMRSVMLFFCVGFGAVLAWIFAKRSRAEEALRQSEDELRSIFEAASTVSFVTTDLSGTEARILEFSPGAEHIFGYSRDETMGQPLGMLHLPEDVAAFPGVIETMWRSKAPVTGEVTLVRKSGERFPALLTTYPVFDPKGEMIKVLGVSIDITERKRAEEARQVAAAQWQATFDGINDTVCLIDADAKVLQCNRAMAEPSGKPPEELIGRSCCELIHGSPTPLKGCPFLRMRKSLRRETQELALGDRWVQVTVDPLTDADGKLTGAVHIVTDITERRRAEETLREREEELRQAHKMEAVGRLAGGIAHDFNNLLTAITGYSEMLMDRLDADDPRRNDVEEINKAGRQGAGLVRQLLAFSRKQVLEPKVLDLNAVVADMQRILHSVLGEDIQLVTALEAECARVKADPVQMEEVVMNLAANARDAMPQGGKLIIETATVELDEDFVTGHPDVTPGSYVMLAVTDTGVGMDEETKSRLFEPFFTTKEVGQGTGLGLSTIYGIVRQSGGDIRVYSEPGEGTVFKIYLPSTEEKVAEAEVEKVAASLRGSETVLVVEDEESVRQFVVRSLRQRGYTVLEAGDSREALPLGEHYEEPIDLLVTDVVMPGLSGPDLARRLERHRPGMRVLYISGYTEHAGLEQEVIEPGAAFLQKPFTGDELARKAREVLDEPSTRA